MQCCNNRGPGEILTRVPIRSLGAIGTLRLELRISFNFMFPNFRSFESGSSKAIWIFLSGLLHSTIAVGGDLAWLKLLLGLTPSYLSPSPYTKAYYKRGILWLLHVTWSAQGDATTMGEKPVIRAGRGCVARPLLVVPREVVVIYLLHMVMAAEQFRYYCVPRFCSS